MITPFGLYEWQRLPFGLCSAPSSFQKIFGELINGIPGEKNFLHDINVCGTNQAEHEERFKGVMQNFAEYDVVINTEKSSFSVDAVDFVGHRVTTQ